MHIIKMEEAQGGWFPVIGIRISRWFPPDDLVVLAAGLCLLFALVLTLKAGRRLIGKIGRGAATILLGAAFHLLALLLESAKSIYHTVLRIPVPWYPTAVLTVIPVAIDIPRWASIPYLLAYCVANAWIMADGVTAKKPKPHETAASKQQPTGAPYSQMFSGMRITIQA